MNFTGYPGINPEILELLGMGSQTTTAPTTDPTYSSGFDYARSIAGGIPASQMIAPGVSYSPEMAGGYTQKDLDMIAAGPAPVMPVAPTQGTPLEASYETMPDAPVGTPVPERYVPGQTTFPGIPDFLKGLDFSGLPDFLNFDYDDIMRQYNDRESSDRETDARNAAQIRSDAIMRENMPPPVRGFNKPDLFFARDSSRAFEPHLDHIRFGLESTPEPAPVMPQISMPELPDFSNIPTPENVSTSFMPGSGMGRIGQGVATDKESLIGKTLFGQKVPVQAPMNFTALPPLPQSFFENIPNQNIDFSQIDYSRIQPNFEMPQITQPIIQPKGGLLGGIGRGISGLQGIQKDFTGFKEDLKNKAANKVLGLFGI